MPYKCTKQNPLTHQHPFKILSNLILLRLYPCCHSSRQSSFFNSRQSPWVNVQSFLSKCEDWFLCRPAHPSTSHPNLLALGHGTQTDLFHETPGTDRQVNRRGFAQSSSSNTCCFAQSHGSVGLDFLQCKLQTINRRPLRRVHLAAVRWATHYHCQCSQVLHVSAHENALTILDPPFPHLSFCTQWHPNLNKYVTHSLGSGQVKTKETKG